VAPLTELLKNPEWFPIGLSQDYRTIRFGRVARDDLAHEAFLDQRMSGSVKAVQEHPVRDIVAQAGEFPAELPVFVFHSAFCCSTLLARAFDAPGRCLSLKEPDVLMGLANALRMQNDPAANKELLRVVLGLLARRFKPGESILIKPTNSANRLLAHVLDLGAPVLILYGDLRSFLVSVIKKGEECKAFIRTQYNIFSLDDGGLAGIPPRQAMTFTDLQVATLVWRHQLEMFQRELTQRASDNIASLDFRRLLEAPAATLEAVARHLGLPHDRAMLDDIACGPVFAQNSKFSDRVYDSGQRARDEASLEQQHADALEKIDEWAKSLNLGMGFDLPLARQLNNPPQ
jgi:hypothetical protein